MRLLTLLALIKHKQVLDLPGIIEGAKDGKGRGRQVISTAKTCNVILIVLDAAKPTTHKVIIERELEVRQRMLHLFITCISPGLWDPSKQVEAKYQISEESQGRDQSTNAT